MRFLIGSVLTFFYGFFTLWAQDTTNAAPAPTVQAASVIETEKVLGLSFTDGERELMLANLSGFLESYAKIRAVPLANETPSALVFDPLPAGFRLPTQGPAAVFSVRADLVLPERRQDLAFWPVTDLAALLRTRKISSTELTQLYLGRLKKYGPKLNCVVTLTEEPALKQAARADREIAAGHYRGPLHGIPYGVKDLFALEGFKTTWGATAFKEQTLEGTATVIARLERAGAVCVAKLSLGALAWGDVWFGGKTRNPWNLEQGSSGSSAGSASATAAGLVGFALGTETYGSIVSPSTRCGTTGLRPSFGRVPRTGAMALSWSMDKVGLLTRSVEDAALVFDVIRGGDGMDRSVLDAPFSFRPEVDWGSIRVGYVSALFEEDREGQDRDRASLDKLKQLGAVLVPIQLPQLPTDALSIILLVEAAAAFDDLTRSGRDDQLVRQVAEAWPNVFRASRLISAVEYVQANRLRYRLMEDMAAVMAKVDLYVCPSFLGTNLLLTNLTGHPCVVLPNGFEEGTPRSISFIGRLFDEASLMAVAQAYQDATDFHRRKPPLFP